MTRLCVTYPLSRTGSKHADSVNSRNSCRPISDPVYPESQPIACDEGAQKQERREVKGRITGTAQTILVKEFFEGTSEEVITSYDKYR